MKKLIIFLVLAVPALAYGWMNVVQLGGGVVESSGSSCSAFSATFEGETDGTELSAISAAWSVEGTPPTDAFEIDTAYYKNGSASAKIDADTTGGNRVYKTFTEQTSGTFEISLYFRTNYDSSTTAQFLIISDGLQSWSSNYVLMLGVSYDTSYIEFEYYNSGFYWSLVETSMSVDTWYHVLLTIDLDNDTFDITLDDTLKIDDAALMNTGLSPDHIYLDDKGATGTNRQVWVDDICIE